MRLLELQNYLIAELSYSGIDEHEARSITRLLLSHKLGIPSSELPLHQQDGLDKSAVEEELTRLKAGEPLQYLLGETEFMGLPIICTPSALIPRGDSEVVAEAAIGLMAGYDNPLIADICTGSGAYALALAEHLPAAEIWAVDIDAEALELAQHNAARLNLQDRIIFCEGDLLQPLQESCRSFDLIVSNPPYVSSGDLLLLPPQVQHEPAIALDGGADGLYFYRRLAADAGAFLTNQGLLLVEHGADQAEAVREIMESGGFYRLRLINDYGRHQRGSLFQRQSI